MSDFADLLSQYNVIGAFWVTVQLTIYAAIGSFVIGAVLAVMRVSPVPSLRFAARVYVNTIRNTPLTLILVFCSLGLWTTMGITLASSDSPTFITDNNFRLAVLGLSVYHASFVCEALRSGVNTVPPGQAEASRAIGLGFFKSLRYVIFPQALRGSIVPLGNALIALTKNTTVASVIGVAEASAMMKTMIEFRPDVIFAIFALFAMGFVIIVLPMGLIITALSKRLVVAR